MSESRAERERRLEAKRVQDRRRLHEICERRRVKRYNETMARWKARGWL